MSGEGRRAFVAGWPIAHSRSPLIHRYWLKRHGIAGDYVREAVLPEGLAAFLDGLKAAGYVGGNVTVPHKEAAAGLCAELTATARRLGAVNTVWLDADGRLDGRLCGDNTDGLGFAANLDAGAAGLGRGWRGGERALIIGAGGAARAVADAILAAGYRRLTIANRTAARAQALAARLRADHGPDAAIGAGLDAVAAALPSADLVVNASSAGLHGEADIAVEWAAARREAIVTDLTYVPPMTPFLHGARQCGLTVVDGLGMLLHQAAPGFERWFGVRPVVDAALRRVVEADLGARTG